MGITYLDGIFTNSSGVTILLSVSAKWAFQSTNTIGLRQFILNHSFLGYLATTNIVPVYSSGAPMNNSNAVFTLLANETFNFSTTQDSGVSITQGVNGSTIVTHCSITRLM